MRGAQPLAQRLMTRAVAGWDVFLDVGVGIVVERAAGLGTWPGGLIELVEVLLAGHERAVGAVERVEEAIARRVQQELAILPVELGVDDRMLRDLVEIVGIVRGVLVAPLDLA